MYFAFIKTFQVNRNSILLFLFLILLAILSGNLTSGMSFVGHLGISFFYKQFSFFKTWWQSAIVFLGVMLIVFLLFGLINKSFKGFLKKVLYFILIGLFIAGFYFTYKDFNTDITYQWMGKRFHTGIYLYWLAACFIGLYFLFAKNKLNKARTHKSNS